MKAFCSKCKTRTEHKEIGEDNQQVYLRCVKCGTERTWLKAGF